MGYTCPKCQLSIQLAVTKGRKAVVMWQAKPNVYICPTCNSVFVVQEATSKPRTGW